jgi:putative endonuclease
MAPPNFLKMFLYILKNNKNRHYIGITKLLPEERLLRHNKGDVYSTKFGRPWRIVYTEKFIDYKSARNKEKQIKSWHGGATLNRFLGKSAGSSNGRTAAFEAVDLGSNPSPADLPRNRKFGGVK